MLSTLLALPALGLAATSAVDPRVLSALQRQPSAPIYVVMRAQPDVSNMRSVVHGDARVAAVVSTFSVWAVSSGASTGHHRTR